MSGTITLRNYRCFTAPAGAELRIQPGFTAIVGPNNAGKSALMRALFELRGVFREASKPSSAALAALLTQQPIGVAAEGVLDQLEIFSDQNNDAVLVDVDVDAAPAPAGHVAVIGARFTADRAQPGIWNCAPRTTTGETLTAGHNVGWSGPYAMHDSTRTVDAAAFASFLQELADSMYIGAFRNSINTGGGAYYDLSVGTGFITMFEQWRAGPLKRQNQLIRNVVDDVRRIMGFRALDISATPGLQTLQVSTERGTYKLAEVGGGIAQMIVCLASAAMRQPSMLLVDEPELNLHPTLQQDFLLSLGKYAKTTVIFASHAIGLARTCSERILTVQPTATGSAVSEWDRTLGFAEFLGEMSYSSYQALGFSQILLVEGPTEVRTFQQWLRLFGKDHSTVVLPLGGSSLINANRAHELSELARFNAPVSVVVDSEAPAAGQIPTDRVRFAAACTHLGFQVLLTSRRATENYFTQSAVQTALGGPTQALGPHDALSGRWRKNDNWRIAAAMSRAELSATDVGAFLQGLS